MLLDGKKISEEIKQEITEEVRLLVADGYRPPHLAAILVGNDGASETYVASKVKSCEQIGFGSTLVRFPADVSEEKLLAEIKAINSNDDIDGLIVQLPLPKHIDEQKVTESVNPKKDVDGFHPVNVGKLVLGLPTFVSATPMGIMELLKRYKIETSGKHCVVLGRSNIVGTPMANLLSRNSNPGNCTVTLCHSKTKNLADFTRTADILIVALGKAEFVTANMVKDGAVVVDVGITRVEDRTNPRGYVLKGDVVFGEVNKKASYITPVPGGVGRMTIAALLQNTLLARKSSIKPSKIPHHVSKS
ncbi:MAG: bifunctional 5,10-methylene-tetrahydrofolate dehydrogenase/5,10-methylene-tetrahydrofolate cyclohydrolase [Flavobacteriales bacterium]|nr:bifunctional 5,10-methylene-tetrahydrofolate dehydrogenase/5,10-methylene-tetrahydrofolate cyclohydrolase [Flavobacteriales bacterium]